MRRHHHTSTALAVLGIAFGLILAAGAARADGKPAQAAHSPFLVAQLGGGLLQGPPPEKGAPVFGAQPQQPQKAAPKAEQPTMSKEEAEKLAAKEHAALLTESRYPNATSCGTCHPREFCAVVRLAAFLRPAQPALHGAAELHQRQRQRHQRRFLHPLPQPDRHDPGGGDRHLQPGAAAVLARGHHLRGLPPHGDELQQGVGPRGPDDGRPDRAGQRADGRRGASSAFSPIPRPIA